jgi:hypothetical protein
LHEREQLRANDLFIDVNKPLNINGTLVGRWISISWFRKLDPDSIYGFYAFDVGYISSIVENLVLIHFVEVAKSYDVPLINIAIGPKVLRCHHQGNISGDYKLTKQVYYFCVLYKETV